MDVVVGTLGKALGTYGAYVCADAEMIRYLINTARPLIFSTAPAPPAVAGALTALELLQERPHRVRRLRANALALRGALALEGFPVAEDEMHIVPLIVGDEREAMRLCQEAIERGVFAQAIRPPTVPGGTSRLRLTVMASHTAAELRMAARVFAEVARGIGLDPAEFGPPLLEQELVDRKVRFEASSTMPPGIPGHAPLAPFDLEQSAEQPEAAPALVEGEAGAPVPDVASGVLFDAERETSIVRAA